MKQLRRLGWLTKKADKGMSLTPLGLALLRAHEMEVSGNDDLQPLVLDAGDALAWGRLLGAIGEQGECLIIDPYLHAPELMQIVEFTQTARVLVGPNLKPREVIELRVLISTPGYQHVELRQAPKRTIHDRYVIGPDKVHLIGGSMGNIGRTTTTILVPLEQDDIKAAIRSRAEEWWAESNTLEPKSSPDVGLAHDA
ncbi:hypothetical protein SAMN05444580_103414 [Rhodococcus tukisamuensis]|uniref:Uncharacterized protein n=1 Tax=Rhodococcus tukisamuensis TaxID=168276 RepID=A0A1G6T633_9NOCA|nr:hypothetical protein SAMN05444580_103414 [Rhodococcus tukisamuensis]